MRLGAQFGVRLSLRVKHGLVRHVRLGMRLGFRVKLDSKGCISGT